MSRETLVHLIGNAHLDPVWLWTWQRGSDEALATCRAACDLLDEYPDAIFTRGEAWVHEEVRRLDPRLFERIRAHARAGRWAVVNGWWVQPDVNLPTLEGLQQNIRLGHAWFREHLALATIPVAYNVDSFGHGAFLPRLLVEAGQPYYVMMRPGPQEMALPGSLFRWQSPDGHEVLVFRVVNAYLANGPDLSGHIQAALRSAPPQVGHVLCFYGVGNHGGGPTRAAVEWIRAHRDFAPGVRLEFSSPARFFAAVEESRARLPLVRGELQYHAIGCYSVCGGLKRDLRRAELAATAAEALAAHADRAEDTSLRTELTRAWEILAFNQFHDILPGSAIPEAVTAQRAQIAEAQSRIDRVTHDLLRGHLRIGQDCALAGQRLHVVNRVERPWAGLVQADVWMDWQRWEHHLEDAEGRVVPHQLVEPRDLLVETGLNRITHILFPARLGPLASLSLRLVRGDAQPASLSGTAPAFADGVLANRHLAVRFSGCGVASVTALAAGQPILAAPLRLECLQDASDTWSHAIDRYEDPAPRAAAFAPPVLVEAGELRATVRLDGTLGQSRPMLFVSLTRDDACLWLELATNFQERLSLLKAHIAPCGGIRARADRVAGGWIERPPNGREVPLHHAARLETPAGPLGVVLPDTFAADGDAERFRPTLIRNSLHALHNCSRVDLATVPRLCERFGTDEGPQTLRRALAVGPALDRDALEAILAALQQPPFAWDDYHAGSRLLRFA